MSEGQGASGPAAPEPPGADGLGRGTRADAASLLLAVERVQDDLRALSRAVAASPEQVAARLDVDAATAAVGVRVGALGSTLDQLRLSLLAALDRVAERVDAPPWLPEVHAVLVGLGRRFDSPVWLPDLQAALSELASTGAERDELRQAVARLDGAVGSGAGIAAALDHLGERLSTIAERVDNVTPPVRDDDQAGALADRLDRVGSGVEAVVDAIGGVARRQDEILAAVARVPDQPLRPEGDDGATTRAVEAVLATVEQQERALAARLDRIDLELRRVGDSAAAGGVPPGAAGERMLDAVLDRVEQQERTIAEHLDWIGSRLADDVRASAAVGEAVGHLGDRLEAVEAAAGQMAEEARLLVDRVAPVPDHLVAIAGQVDRISGEQSEVREREADGGPLDAVVEVLAAVTRRQDEVATAVTSLLDQARSSKGLEAVFERAEQRERSLAARLDRIDAELRRLGHPASRDAETPDAETARAVDAVAASLEQQERALAARLDQIDLELRRVGEATAAPAVPPDADGGIVRALDAVLDRVQQQEHAITTQLDWVGDRLADVAARLVPERDVAVQRERADDERLELAAVLERMSRRQDELAAALSSLVDQVRGPTAVEAVFDRMEQRERSLAARLDRIDLELRRRSSSPDPEPADGISDLARLVESVAERLDRRLSGVEATLQEATRRPAPPPAPARPSASAEAAALRLAELRAERAQVQARLQEERLLAAEAWDDDAEGV